jgi:hypothetical protein
MPSLLRFLTISTVIELHLKRDGSRWKAKTQATSSMNEGEHGSAFKIVKIVHKKTLDCYFPTITVLILNCYYPTSP